MDILINLEKESGIEDMRTKIGKGLINGILNMLIEVLFA